MSVEVSYKKQGLILVLGLLILLSAVEIIFRGELGNKEKIEKKTNEYREKLANPFIAGSRGFIDDVIMPNTTRKRICRSLEMLKNKKLNNPWKKHDNIPL